MLLRFAVVAVVLAASSGLCAERDFAFTWSSATLARGHQDLEAWLTPRIAREEDTFALTEARFMMTAGLLDSLETSVAIDLGFPTTETSATIDPRLSSLWKWAPLKASDVVGVAMVARASLGFDVAELEARLVLDKRLGRVMLGLNASYERLFFWNARRGVDTHLEENVGLRYAIGEAASVGLELRFKSGFLRGDYQGTGIYVGPSFTTRLGRTWFTFGALAQVAADKAAADKGNGERLEVRDNERFMFRIIVGGHTN